MLFIFIIKYKLLVLNPVSVLQIFLLLILRPVNGIESRHVLITSVLFLSNFRYSFIICNHCSSLQSLDLLCVTNNRG